MRTLPVTLILSAVLAASAHGAPTPTPAPTPVLPAGVPLRPSLPESLGARPIAQPTATPASIIERIEPGRLPSWEDLRLEGGETTSLGRAYLESLPILTGEVFTTQTVFSDVPPTSPLANQTLSDLIEVGLQNSLTLQNNSRTVASARSSMRSAEAQFEPFVDLVGGGRLAGGTDRNYPGRDLGGDGRRDSNSTRLNGGIEATQNLPSGGRITANTDNSRTDTFSSGGGDLTVNDTDYAANAEARLVQPLLRGAGFDIGTADLRRSRLSELNTLIGYRIAERDLVLSIIRSYFNILSIKQTLQVSADAIRERRRFLEETRVRYEVGQVAESEILRAEIQFLQELEGAVSRRQQLENAREQLLIVLGLPLDTPISLVDITPTLLERGRVDVPAPDACVAEALANRPEFLQDNISLAQSEISHRVARNELLPNLDFDAGYGRNDEAGRFRESLGYNDSEWDAGLTLRVPLINTQRREAARRAALDLESNRTDRLIRERNIRRDVIEAQRSVIAAEANLTILRKTVEQARKNLQLINGSFEVGFSSVTEVRLAQDDLFQAETRYSNALLNYQVLVAELYVALGRSLF